jgi:hypothetical protein
MKTGRPAFVRVEGEGADKGSIDTVPDKTNDLSERTRDLGLMHARLDIGQVTNTRLLNPE